MNLREWAIVAGVGLLSAALSYLVAASLGPLPQPQDTDPPVDSGCQQALEQAREQRAYLEQDVRDLRALLDRMQDEPVTDPPPPTE